MSEYKNIKKEIPSTLKQHSIAHDSSIYSSQTVFSAIMTLA